MQLLLPAVSTFVDIPDAPTPQPRSRESKNTKNEDYSRILGRGRRFLLNPHRWHKKCYLFSMEEIRQIFSVEAENGPRNRFLHLVKKYCLPPSSVEIPPAIKLKKISV